MRDFRKISRSLLAISGIGLAALAASSANAQTQYRIQVPDRPAVALEASGAQGNFDGSVEPVARAASQITKGINWFIEPIAGTPYYRLRTTARDGYYLNNETKAPMVGPIQNGWWSAQWTLTNVAGTTNLRICNRWTSECLRRDGFSNSVRLTMSQPSDANSHWSIPGFGGVPAPKPAPVAGQAATAGPSNAAKTVEAMLAEARGTMAKASKPCGVSFICYVQLTGLVVEKRSEISDDEIYVTVTNDGWQGRFPEKVRESSRLPIMTMNQSKPGYMTFNFCSVHRLDRMLVMEVMESDPYTDNDNSHGQDDKIGAVGFLNLAEKTGSFSKLLTGDGSRYWLVYSVAPSREELPACSVTPLRDPDIGGAARTISACEQTITDAMGVPTTSEAAIVYLLAYGVCEIDEAVKKKS